MRIIPLSVIPLASLFLQMMWIWACSVKSSMSVASDSLKKKSSLHVQWGEQVFDTLPILQVFLLTKYVEVCNFLKA
jgi:hypothetical protein